MKRLGFIFLVILTGTRIYGIEPKNSLNDSIQNKALNLSVAVTDISLDSTITRSILQGNLNPGFINYYSDKYISKGFTSSTILVRLEVFNDTDSEEFILNLGNSHLDRVELFELSKLGSRIGGDNIPFSDWGVSEIRISFPLKLPRGESESILLKINTSSAVNIKPTIVKPENFYKYLSSTKTLYGFFYGSIGIMIVYNFIIFLMIQEKVYLYYSFAILSNLGIQVFINGMDLYILGDFPEIRNKVGAFFVGSSAFFGVYFAREFLNSSHNMPKLDRVLKLYASLAVIATSIFILFFERSKMVVFANIIAQIFSLIVLYTIFRGLVLGVRQAKLFLLAWGFLLFGIILYSLLEAGAIPYTFVTVFSNQFGSVLEATILSIAMAERLRSLKKEKEEAHKLAFANLELVIQERTKQLNHTLQDIQKDIQMAKRIQIESLPDENWNSTRIKFVRIFKPKSIIGGDTYDITKLSEGKYRIFIADATGHGVQAALITMAIRSEYQAIKKNSLHPGEVLNKLNKTFMDEYYSLKIIFSCCVADIDTLNGMIYFSSAGHPSQLLVRNMIPTLIDKTGRIIGLSLESDYQVREFKISPNDRLYLYTDGITEQENNNKEEFGERRLVDFLISKHYRELRGLIKEIELTFDLFRGKIPQSDDITLLCMEVKNSID